MTSHTEPASLRLTVLLFASLAEALERSELTLALPAGATAGEALAAVMSDPRAAGLSGRVRVAVNQAFAAPDRPLQPGDEVALIPPVAGG